MMLIPNVVNIKDGCCSLGADLTCVGVVIPVRTSSDIIPQRLTPKISDESESPIMRIRCSSVKGF